MRILSIEKTPVHEWTYLSAAPRGGSELRHLPLLPATVDALPAELEALIVTSDLQGVATNAEHEGAAALLGEVLAEELAILADLGELPHANHLGILLAGDLYSDASGAVRGASGDVRSVWSAFAERFRWVAGVAGNHDTFGTPRERERLLQRPGLHLLDGEVRELDGLQVGGLSGIIGQAGEALAARGRGLPRGLEGGARRRPRGAGAAPGSGRAVDGAEGKPGHPRGAGVTGGAAGHLRS